MRKLLIVLLFLIVIAQMAALVPTFGIDGVSMLATVNVAPIIMSVGALLSAFMLITRTEMAFIPYFMGFAGFLVMEVAVFGPSMLKSSALGFIVAILFFLPSARASK